MNKFFITIFFLFSSLISSFSFAVDRDEYWLQRDIQIGDGRNQYGKKVYGKAARAVMEDIPLANGTSSRVEQMIKRSIAVDKPTASKVGGSMMKRISHYVKTPGIQMIGVLAVTQLLEGIGWILEDGGYVKYIEPENCGVDGKNCPDKQYLLQESDSKQTIPFEPVTAPFAQSVCKSHIPPDNTSQKFLKTENIYPDFFGCVYDGSGTIRTTWFKILNPSYSDKPPEKEKIPLTAALLGAAMLGTGYVDPDPKFDNTRVNTGGDTGVKEIYEQDPSGVGNELADAMDDKLKNAKPTDDGKPSYIGDPKYDDRPLSDDRDDSSDRSWDEKGDEATGGTEPTKDPQTGEATGGQSITIQFPLFCSWASKMCQWYDDWKASDKIHQKFEEDVKNHQTDEKSFWQTVKDWFDWSKKEDDLPEKDNSDIDLNDELIIDQKTKNISWSAQCPTAQTVPINFHGVTAEITVADFSYLCSLDWLIKPFVIAFASISAAFIVFGFNRGGDDG